MVNMGGYYFSKSAGLVKVVCRAYNTAEEAQIVFAEIGNKGVHKDLKVMSEKAFITTYLAF